MARSQPPLPISGRVAAYNLGMTIFGNICAGLIGCGAFCMFRFVSQSTDRFDYVVAGGLSLVLLAGFLAVFAAVTSTGKLDFLGCPRLLQYAGVVIACLSVAVLMGVSAALHGSGGREFPLSVQPFCPWAAYMAPLLMALIGVLWLNVDTFAVPEYLPRVAFGAITAIALLSNIVFGVEIRLTLQRQSDERAREDLAIVQQTDPEKEFSWLLHYSSRFERPAVRQLALEKIFATGARFNALMTECLRAPVFEEGLTFLRDNDPPRDSASLAEPARDAVLLLAQRLRDEIATGRPLKADDLENRLDSVITVAGKLSNSGADFLPPVRECRAALRAAHSGQVPHSSLKKIDAWLSAKAK